MDSLTILVPTRNRPDDLACCLRSIRTGFGPGQKVVIGDNGDHSVTEELLKAFTDLFITHLKNPPGNTYVGNLLVLLTSASTDWLAIMHDDDFFNGEVLPILQPVLADPETDFIFSDHWFSDSKGNIDPQKTEEMYHYYGRNTLKPGVQKNPGYLAAKQKIALDGFYIRRDLATKIPMDPSQPIATDMKWLIETCSESRKTVYLAERLFTYRMSLLSLTSTTDHLKGAHDFWITMCNTRSKDPATMWTIHKLRFKSLLRVLRVLVKRTSLSILSSKH
jgi:glycosyltransferase involved in cell wall biosynthesis